MMKALKAGLDFFRTSDVNPTVGEKFLIKQSIATGWANLAVVTRVMRSQFELKIINVIPTEESNRFGTKNGLKDNREIGGFFKEWQRNKKLRIGRKVKFFRSSGIMVGQTSNWNPDCLAELSSQGLKSIANQIPQK